MELDISLIKKHSNTVHVNREWNPPAHSVCSHSIFQLPHRAGAQLCNLRFSILYDIFLAPTQPVLPPPQKETCPYVFTNAVMNVSSRELVRMPALAVSIRL